MTEQTAIESELIVALVLPVGTDRKALTSALARALTSVGYAAIPIRLSKLLERCATWEPLGEAGEAERIAHLQRMGNKFRQSLSEGGALARAAVVAIREERAIRSKHPDKSAGRVAYILDQLKHPAEVDLLRQVYGSAFILIGAHAPKEKRTKDLAEEIAEKLGRSGDGNRHFAEADTLIQNDENQDGDFGQNTRDAYPKADFFINLGITGGEHQIDRFVELLFGHPFHTPTKDEYVMYQATAASLRSSDDSRQVGAAIATDQGDVVAVGSNEAPVKGGGLYWAGESPDARDQALQSRDIDRPTNIKTSVLVELLGKLQDAKLLANDAKVTPEEARRILPLLKGTGFSNIGEFGRTVHAEMASLIDAAKRGVAVDKLAMYVTTFPCHNCAKHIVAAGIRVVIYLEPYPKSRAGFLHQEEIELETDLENAKKGKHMPKVAFAPFSGVAPRQYYLLFSMSARGAKKGVPLKEWPNRRTTLSPRYVMANAPYAYVAAERQALELLSTDKFKWDKAKVCPSL